MIKAGALLYAMFLVIVISIISSSFILINYYNNTYVLHVFKQEQLFKDVCSGINYGLALHQEIPLNNKSVIQLFDDDEHQVTLTKKAWGAFYRLTAEAHWRNKSVSKTALIGTNFTTGEKTAIYLADQNKPLSLTGKTNIVGNCYLPESGVKRAYIEGKSFSGNQLINGQKQNSSKTLPAINENLIQANYTNFSTLVSEEDSVVDYELVMEQDSILNSFENKTLVLFSPFSINISNKVIEGNIMIKSDRNIVIESSAKINNIICYAKGIIIENQSQLSAQFFAQDSIIIEDKCQLNYPSVVALLGKGNGETSKKIMIGKEVIVKGAVFLFNETFDRKNQAIVSIDENSEIMGQVYSSELLELKGVSIKGNVFCKSFILRTPSSVYENHLMDVTIDRIALSEYFVGVALTEEINHHQIIKWLN